MLKADSVVGNRIDEALGAGVKVLACENTMRKQKLTQAECSARSATCLPGSSKSCSASSRVGLTSGRSAAAGIPGRSHAYRGERSSNRAVVTVERVKGIEPSS